MLKRVGILLMGILFSACFWFLNDKYPKNLYYLNLFYSFIAFVIIYLILKIIIEKVFANKLTGAKSKYSFKKIISIIYFILLLVTLTFIWIENVQSLLVAYGIIGAGFALAMQDVFKNFIGGLTIFINKPFRVGDRIEVNSKSGDVLDIGILYTSLLEIKEWVKGDQATGRVIKIPNSFVLSNAINNYTDDHEFIWDEISLPITYDSNWKDAQKKILQIITKETKDIIEKSNKEIEKLEEKYYLEKRPTEPAVFMTLTDNWANLSVRYVTETRRRRIIHDKLSQLILTEIQKSKKIKIASQTIDIVGFPKRKK